MSSRCAGLCSESVVRFIHLAGIFSLRGHFLDSGVRDGTDEADESKVPLEVSYPQPLSKKSIVLHLVSRTSYTQSLPLIIPHPYPPITHGLPTATALLPLPDDRLLTAGFPGCLTTTRLTVKPQCFCGPMVFRPCSAASPSVLSGLSRGRVIVTPCHRCAR